MPSLNILSLQRLSEVQVNSICEVADDVNVLQCSPKEASAYIDDTDILIAWGSFHLGELLPKAKRLQWVHALSAGVDGILTPEVATSDLILSNSRGIHGIPVAEHVFAMILNFTRGITKLHENKQAHQWQSIQAEEIYDKTIAIIGLGSIGREIAKRAKAMGMKVLATKRTITTELFVDKLYTNDQLPQLLPLADFVVITLPLTPETNGLFDQSIFAQMKSSAYFINIARGAIVNEADLITALRENTIRGAGLDVYSEEPLPPDSPFWQLPNVFVSPHIASKSPLYIDRSLKVFIENFNKFLSKTPLFNVIDKQRGY